MKLSTILRELMEQREFETTPEMLERFDIYYSLLSARNKETNLVANADATEIAERHIIDSLSVAKTGIIHPTKPAKAVDVGTGAGFPGIPLKIFMPQLDMILMDSLGKKVDFLREVVAELGMDGLNVVQARAEEAGHDPEFRGQFDYSFSRAVAKLNVLSELSLPMLKVGGSFCAMKSTHIKDELRGSLSAIKILGGALGEQVTYETPEVLI